MILGRYIPVAHHFHWVEQGLAGATQVGGRLRGAVTGGGAQRDFDSIHVQGSSVGRLDASQDFEVLGIYDASAEPVVNVHDLEYSSGVQMVDLGDETS